MSTLVRNQWFVETCRELYKETREKKEVWRLLETRHGKKVSYQSVLRALRNGVANKNLDEDS